MDLLLATLLYLLIGFILDMILLYVLNKYVGIGDVEQFVIFALVLLFWPMVIQGVLICIAAFGLAYPLYKLYSWFKNRREND